MGPDWTTQESPCSNQPAAPWLTYAAAHSSQTTRIMTPQPEPSGAIPWLWITTAGVGNAFAAFWLLRAAALQFPALAALLRWRPGALKACGGQRADDSDELPASMQLAVHQQLASAAAPTPHMQTTLEWRDVSFWAAPGTANGTPQQLLHGVWGGVASRQVLAVMGPSGAGKSTLLEILALRRGAAPPAGGVLLLNSVGATQRTLQAASSFVAQEDALLPQLTVRETLQLHAGLRLPPQLGPNGSSGTEQRIQEVLDDMGLAQSRDTLVGGVLPGGILLRGLSGGERKRLAIGTGILPRPAIIFADEPTSGLDSFAAMSTMSRLSGLSHGPHACAVVATLHQPRIAIWDLLDLVSLLSCGRLLYHGPTAGLLPWLTLDLPPLLGLAPDTPPFQFRPSAHGTLPDWALDLASLPDAGLPTGDAWVATAAQQFVHFGQHKALQGSGAFSTTLAEPLQPTTAVHEAVAQGQGEVVAAHADAHTEPALAVTVAVPAGPPPPAVAAARDVAPGAWRRYRTLVWRESLAAVRNPADVAGRMLTFVWVAMVGNFLLYGGGQQDGDADGMLMRVSWLYFVLFFYMVMPFLFMSVFTADKRAYLSDVSAGLYRPGVHYLAKLTASLPLNIFISLGFSLTAYGMFGFRHDVVAGILVAAAAALFSLVCLQWMYLATAVSPNQDIAFVLAVGFAVVNLLINSMFMRPGNRGGGLGGVRALRYISAMDYALQALLTAEFKGRVFACNGALGIEGMGLDALGLFPQFMPASPGFTLLRRWLSSPSSGPQACVASGDVLLEHYGILPRAGVHIGALAAYLAILHIATWAGLVSATYRAVLRGGHAAISYAACTPS